MNVLVVIIILILAVYTLFIFNPVYAILHSVYCRIKADEYTPKETCDIITPLNTYTNVDCDTLCFYDKHLTFKYDDGVTVEVSASTANITFHDNK